MLVVGHYLMLFAISLMCTAIIGIVAGLFFKFDEEEILMVVKSSIIITVFYTLLKILIDLI